jgi:TetR/AcrR family transcriptional repressor of nem operon
LVNTALELSPHDEEIAKSIRASFASVEKFFADQIRSAQRNGAVCQELDADETAKVLFGLLLGLRVLARAGAEQPAKQAIVEQVRQLLK